MTRWFVVAVVLAMAVVACSDSDGSDAAGVVTPAPTVTVTVMATPSVTVTRTPPPTATRTATVQLGEGPTLAQLRQARLSKDDLKGAWLDWTAGQMEKRYPAVFATFLPLDSGGSEEWLRVELHDARNGVPDFVALGLLDGVNLSQMTQTAPTGFGANGVRYRYNYREDGEQVYGEIAAWREGQTVVAIQVEGLDTDVCVCEFAELQQKKLTAAVR